MGDYGYKICTVCGRDVLWEEAPYMKDGVVCCSEKCRRIYCEGPEPPAQGQEPGPAKE